MTNKVYRKPFCKCQDRSKHQDGTAVGSTAAPKCYVEAVCKNLDETCWPTVLMATAGAHYVIDRVKEQLANVNYTAGQIAFALGRAV